MGEKGSHALLILAAVCATYFFENFLRQAPSALTPILIEDLGITHGMAGLLISAYFFLYAFMQIPSGVLSDALGPRRTIIGFTVFTVLGTGLFYFASDVNTLLAAQLLIGLGSSVLYINAVRIVSNWFPAEKKASAIGVLSAASGLGNFAAYIGFPLAISLIGSWKTLYLVCSGLLVVNFVVNLLFLRDSPDGVDSWENGGNSVWASLRQVFTFRQIYPLIAGYILLSSSWVFLSWIPQFLTDAKGLPYIDVGLVSSVGSVMGIPGCILMGVISDRLRRRKFPLVAFSVAYVALLVLFLGLPRGTPTVVFSLLNAGIGFAISLWVLFFAMIPESLPPEVAGIALGLVNGIGTLGFSLMTPVYGALVDVTGTYVASNAILVIAGIGMTLIFAFFTKESYGLRDA